MRRPPGEHPKRPVLGFDCERSEVSGQRVWGWVQERFGTPEAFFARFFVWPPALATAQWRHPYPRWDERLRYVPQPLDPVYTW